MHVADFKPHIRMRISTLLHSSVTKQHVDSCRSTSDHILGNSGALFTSQQSADFSIRMPLRSNFYCCFTLARLATTTRPNGPRKAPAPPPPPASVISARDSMSRITDTYTRVTLAHSTASSLSVALSPCDSKGSPSSTVFFSHRYYGYLTEPLRGERPLLGNPTIPGRAIQPIGTKSTNIDVILFPCHVFIFHAWG